MFDSDAIKTLTEAESISAANVALVEVVGNDRYHAGVALPQDYTVHDLEKFLPQRRRARGTMTTSVMPHFADYATANKEAGAAVFVNAKDMKAHAVLNLGTPAQPGHADNLAVFEAQQTAPFKALLENSGKGLKQQDAAEFLEDWSAYIQCSDDAGGHIELRKAVSAFRRLTIESARKVESEVGRLAATASALDSVKASSVEAIPAVVSFTCEPYLGLDKRTINMRVGILTTDKPAIVLRIINMEAHREEMSHELAALITQAIAGAMPVHIGTYSAKS